jgi:hypothetical protein
MPYLKKFRKKMSDPSTPNATDRIVAQSARRQRERAQVPTPRSAAIIETATVDLTESEALTSSNVEEIRVDPELDLEKGTTIRLQRTIFNETKLDGVVNNYNRDTYFEAAWIILKAHPEIQSQVIEEAKRRSILRRKAGRNRAAQTMGKNYSNGN